MGLSWEGCLSCCGWGSLRFISLHMGCLSGLVLGGVMVLLWVCLGRGHGLVLRLGAGLVLGGAVLDSTVYKWDVWVHLSWVG